jgi:aspartate dehydrogenase
MLEVTLIGFGAIGQSICQGLAGSAQVRVSHVVVRAGRVAEAQAVLEGMSSVNSGARQLAVTEVPVNSKLALECAGHEALKTHVIAALQRGIECAVLSVGALSEPGLPELLSNAAAQGATQVHLLSGAIGGIDALAAAKLAGLDEVTYTGRKPPSAWAIAELPGAAATPKLEEIVVTSRMQKAYTAIILEASARDAARLYPKNANVAATVALAGLGLDATRVRLIADPSITENIHEIHAKGAFGEMKIEMRGKPLADNPKTSALTVLSALRFLRNRANPLTI